jgi:biotin-(acetyl-CoA carboxylase) ligase
MGQPLIFTARDTGTFEGVIRGVDAFGRLEIMTAGRIRAFQTGDLVFHHFRKGN